MESRPNEITIGSCRPPNPNRYAISVSVRLFRGKCFCGDLQMAEPRLQAAVEDFLHARWVRLNRRARERLVRVHVNAVGLLGGGRLIETENPVGSATP